MLRGPSLPSPVPLMSHVDRLGRAELARTIRRTERDAERILGHAGEYLRQRLHDSGCHFTPPPV